MYTYTYMYIYVDTNVYLYIYVYIYRFNYIPVYCGGFRNFLKILVYIAVDMYIYNICTTYTYS